MPEPLRPLLVTHSGTFHLDDVTEFNGPLMFVPGSHKREIPFKRSVDGEKWELWTVPHEAVTELVNELGMVSAKGPRGTLQMSKQRHTPLTMYLGQVQKDGSVKLLDTFKNVDPGAQCPNLKA